MAKRPTLEHYKRVLQLRRARVPADVITMIVGIPLDLVQGLLDRGLPAKKGKHPAQRPIRAVLVEDQAEQTTQAIEWAGSVGAAARQAASERAKTALGAAKIERLLIDAWTSKIQRELSDARENGRPVDIANLMGGRDLLFALRTLAKTRDLAPDVRAPFELYRGRLENRADEDDSDEDVLDPSLYADLLGLDETELEHFAQTGQKLPRQLGLPAVENK